MTPIRNLETGAPIRCTRCGSPDVISIAPGQAEERTDAGGILVAREVPPIAWCINHAPWVRGHQEVLAL